MKHVMFGRRAAALRLIAAVCSLALLALVALDHSVAQQQTVSIEVAESVGVSDSQQALPPESAEVAEALGVADTVAVVPPVSIEVAESVSVADAQQAIPPASVETSEGVQVTDVVLVVPPAVIEISEAIGVIDSLGDSDEDGTVDLADTCPSTANSSQSDGDADAVGSACDTCPATPNGPAERFVLGVGYQDDSDSDARPGTQPPAGATFGGDACDVDDDNDGKPDTMDGCRTLAEDYDGFEDGDGCPDTDNDGDGICDPGFLSIACVGSDVGRYQWKNPLAAPVDCRNVREDFDNFHDTDGCPEPDNDYDTFPDHADDCPGADSNAGPDGIADTGDEPVLYLTPYQAREDFDGVIDTDGCHDSPNDDYDGDGLGDETEVFTIASDPVNPDTDADTVGDGIDNCPTFANPAQNLPAWAVPANDGDCDGFNKVREEYMGTNPSKRCSNTATENDEPMDAWPSDFNDSRFTSLADVVLMGPVYNQPTGSNMARKRFDLNASGVVSLADVVLMGPFYNKGCA